MMDISDDEDKALALAREEGEEDLLDPEEGLRQKRLDQIETLQAEVNNWELRYRSQEEEVNNWELRYRSLEEEVNNSEDEDEALALWISEDEDKALALEISEDEDEALALEISEDEDEALALEISEDEALALEISKDEALALAGEEREEESLLHQCQVLRSRVSDDEVAIEDLLFSH